MRIGKLEITGSFFLLAAWLNYLDRYALVPLAMLACALHELGHYAAAKRLGCGVRKIRLTAVGAEMKLSGQLGYGGEIAVAAAGPCVNILLSFIFCRWEWGCVFAGLNLALGCFNLLPIGRLDGGRIVYCVLAVLLGPDLACAAEGCLDIFWVTLLLAAGVILCGAAGNITLLLVALWLMGIYSGVKKTGNRSCQEKQKQVK